jgi:DNA-directed RNA polymerase specialized sigma24 family protein
MSAPDSVTNWIAKLKEGDQAAAQPLWERYFRRLVHLARTKLRGTPRRAADEEDVALSAFDSFCRGAERGQFPQLSDRDNLWPLLVVITARKALDLVRHEHRQKRGGGTVRGESALLNPRDPAERQGGIDEVIGPEPSPAFAAQVAEECQRLLEKLDDAQLRSVALWKMEGYSNDEIAERLGCVARTVERKLRVIRATWGQREGGR